MYRHAGLDSRLDKQWVEMEIALANLAQGGIHRRHHRGNDDATNISCIDFFNREEISEQHSVFIDSMGLDGSDAPVGNHARLGPGLLHKAHGRDLVHAQDRVGVAYINDQ